MPVIIVLSLVLLIWSFRDRSSVLLYFYDQPYNMVTDTLKTDDGLSVYRKQWSIRGVVPQIKREALSKGPPLTNERELFDRKQLITSGNYVKVHQLVRPVWRPSANSTVRTIDLRDNFAFAPQRRFRLPTKC